ncbi:hypothetical protein H257_17526 [Aphanomyces astaci]|uniref:Uncharacterized protein n=1 Tax=Aphanomyces astaci TaxID=112090 RepID=W4FEI0_APHAT|nr:hypothetical protein H257_17526 [Aphanomyces astaci]ETV65885.1 hypothetical protein H257_17526 [Aphanomyces astaci]|eukprot:XP_009844638.1 hypothetical protein H257_17526 [Aphanomyces astaci]
MTAIGAAASKKFLPMGTVTPLMEGDIDRYPVECRLGLQTMSDCITSLRQAAEWGMGVSRFRVYRQLLLPLPYNPLKRRTRLDNIFRLYNFRRTHIVCRPVEARLVSPRSTLFLLWSSTSTLSRLSPGFRGFGVPPKQLEPKALQELFGLVSTTFSRILLRAEDALSVALGMMHDTRIAW